MKLVSPQPFWPVRDGLPATYPVLEDNLACEAAVIGGGIGGALVAWQLASAGVETIVLDRREIAHGSTAGSTSLLQYEIDEPLHRLTQRIGRERAERCYRRCRDAIDEIERLVRNEKLNCEFERRPSLLLASTRAHLPRLRREFAARHSAGLAVEWWSRRDLARESSLPQPAAIWSRDGAQVDAYALAHGLLQAARRAGARVYERTAVTRMHFHARGADLQTARGRRVRARNVVIATGYEAQESLRKKITALHSTYALASEPVAEFNGWPADRCLIWETARPYVYLRTTADRRVMIGGYDEPFRDPDARDRLLGVKTALLKRRFRQLFPRIPLEVACAWAGTFAETTDGLPYIGRHRNWPHVWYALGYGGNGVTFSSIAASLIRDGILGRRNADEALFGFGRAVGA